MNTLLINQNLPPIDSSEAFYDNSDLITKLANKQIPAAVNSSAFITRMNSLRQGERTLANLNLNNNMMNVSSPPLSSSSSSTETQVIQFNQAQKPVAPVKPSSDVVQSAKQLLNAAQAYEKNPNLNDNKIQTMAFHWCCNLLYVLCK